MACAVPADRVSDSSGIVRAAGGNEDHSGAVQPSGKKLNPPTHSGTGGRAVQVVVADRIAHRLGARPRGLRESVLGRYGIHRHGRAQCPDRERVAVGLLPHEPALVGAAAGEGRGGHVDLLRQGNSDTGKHRPPETPRPGDSFLSARASGSP